MIYNKWVIGFVFGYEVGICMLVALIRQEGSSGILLWGYGALVLIMTVISGFWVEYRIKHPKTTRKKQMDPGVGLIVVIIAMLLRHILTMYLPESAFFFMLIASAVLPICFIPQTVALAVELCTFSDSENEPVN